MKGIRWQLQRRAYVKINRMEGDSLDQKLQAEGIALVAPADTVARAYAGVAGLLNLMCIFDALMLSIMGTTGEPAERKSRRREIDKADDT